MTIDEELIFKSSVEALLELITPASTSKMFLTL